MYRMNESAPLDGTLSVEEPSFRWFFEAEYRRLCEALYLLTGDAYEAEDLAQEAMTRALERWDRVARMDSPAGYVYRTDIPEYTDASQTNTDYFVPMYSDTSGIRRFYDSVMEAAAPPGARRLGCICKGFLSAIPGREARRTDTDTV